MGRSPLLPMADRLLDGQLRTFLAERRGDGVSYELIARELDTAGIVQVTGETIRSWCRELEIEG